MGHRLACRGLNCESRPVRRWIIGVVACCTVFRCERNSPACTVYADEVEPNEIIIQTRTINDARDLGYTVRRNYDSLSRVIVKLAICHLKCGGGAGLDA